MIQVILSKYSVMLRLQICIFLDPRYRMDLEIVWADLRMRSSLVVRASDCQCTSCNGPGFDPSIRPHSGIWGAADEAVLNIVRKKKKKSPPKILKKTCRPTVRKPRTLCPSAVSESTFLNLPKYRVALCEISEFRICLKWCWYDVFGVGLYNNLWGPDI